MKSNVEWKAWVKHDPLFAVFSWKGKGKDEALAWTDEEFYSLGEKDWTDFKERWEPCHHVSALPRDRLRGRKNH